MVSQQGSLELLQHPVAQEMLHAPIPARLAYVWMDGTPRVVPIAFHWDGQEIVMAGPTDAPKVRALAKNPNVAVTLDNTTMPYKVLLIRGKIKMNTVDGIVPEYALAVERYMGKEGADAWLNQMRALASQMTRMALRPAWVGIIDFESRFPSAIESAMARLHGA